MNAEQIVFEASNNHSPNCGTPPAIRNVDHPDVYYGYFENEHGEQWLFSYDRRSRKGILRGGDVYWEKSFEVRDGTVAELFLGREEWLWLRACWNAATALDSSRRPNPKTVDPECA